MNGAEPERRAVFRAVNVDGTSRLVRQAVAAGVKRFVSISSVKVNGESTLLGSAFIETDVCNP
jgi:UDP-glucose 4-epimerase